MRSDVLTTPDLVYGARELSAKLRTCIFIAGLTYVRSNILYSAWQRDLKIDCLIKPLSRRFRLDARENTARGFNGLITLGPITDILDAKLVQKRLCSVFRRPGFCSEHCIKLTNRLALAVMKI